MEKYLELADEEIVKLYQSGDEQAMEYLLMRYTPLVKKKANAYFLIGAEQQDLIQEGMVGLYQAIENFNVEKNVTFFSFAQLCIQRQMLKAVEKANRMKNQPLNQYVSLCLQEEEAHKMLQNVDKEEYSNPEYLILLNEQMLQFQESIKDHLSDFEQQVLQLYLEGNDYRQIASMIHKTDKSIDNALQRIRQKIRKIC